MNSTFRKTMLGLCLLLPMPAFAATDWQKPTQEELTMTSQPEVPGAAAVYLYREETTQDNEATNEGNNFHRIYVRLKILAEPGKRYADVVIPYEDNAFTIGNVEGRTIHPDGTVIPFTGKPYKKVVSKTKNYEESETVFTLPDVQVGSIIEYRYQLKYSGYVVVAPRWDVQRELFLRSGYFYFAASRDDIMTGPNATDISNGVAYTEALPPGSAVKFIFSQHAFELNVHNIAPIPDEEWTPPLQSLTYRVLFYYTGYHTAKEYWSSEGRNWSKNVDRFASSSKLKDAVAQIVAPADTPTQKVSKIYDAVMQLENTSFTREHTAAENKAVGIKIKTADDIWNQKRGNNDEITLLFIAMVRAAGLNAYAMNITDRDHAIFSETYLRMDQLDDYVAIVEIDGKEQFFDPGQRYCTFGQLQWAHTITAGLRQGPSGALVATTPGFGYEDAQTIRVAQIQLAGDGTLKGIVKMKMTGPPALYWRQLALRTDEAEVKRQLEETLQRSLPAGVQVKTNHFVGLADWKTDLTVVLDVTGGMGTASSKRIFLPSSFFEASDKPLFVHDHREDAIDLHYSSIQQDTVSLTLPAQATIESLPKDMRMPLAKSALFVTKYATKGNTYTQTRIFVLASPFYEPKDYPDLKDFYQKVNAQDQEQLVVTIAAPAAGQ